MRVGPRTPTTPIACPGRPYAGQDERDVAHVERLVLVSDEDLDLASPGDAADELAEVGPVLESREDAPELVALRELGRLHDVEQAVAEDLLDGRRVVLAHDLDDPLADPPGELLHAIVRPQGGEPRLGARRGHARQALVEDGRDGVERGLVDRFVSVEGHKRLLDGTFAQDEDEAGHPAR